MNAPIDQPAQPAPNFVTCHCQHCDGGIEFDANEFAEENSIVSCPHCGLETKIFIPVLQTEKVPTELPSSVASPTAVRREGFFCGEEAIQETGTGVSGEPIPAQVAVTLPKEPQTQIPISPPKDELPRQTQPQPQNTGLNPDLWRDLPRSDDDEFILHNPHGAATPKQVAYLTYMGVKNAQDLTKQEAHDLIESNCFFGEPNSLAEFERQRAYQANWQTKRLILYPDLYVFELKDYLHNTLPEELHTYVRGQIVGASERLAKSKIRDVVNALTRDDARWWHQTQYETVFLERLKQTYPKCCDGHSPINRT